MTFKEDCKRQQRLYGFADPCVVASFLRHSPSYLDQHIEVFKGKCTFRRIFHQFSHLCPPYQHIHHRISCTPCRHQLSSVGVTTRLVLQSPPQGRDSSLKGNGRSGSMWVASAFSTNCIITDDLKAPWQSRPLIRVTLTRASVPGKACLFHFDRGQ